MQNLLLRIQSITKTFNDGIRTIEALKGVSLDIYKGEILTLLGVNGAGKTTLSSIISTLHPATSGNIEYENQSIYNDVIEYRRMIGFCPQQPNIDAQLTIEQNMLFAGRYFGLPEEKIQERMQLLMNRFGLMPYAKQKGFVLSGGYKQRFLLARTLIHEPKLIILDEPTVGLDPHIRRDIWKILKELKHDGITILLTTHYLDEAEQLSDRVCLLDKGVVKFIDTPENLKKAHAQNNLEDIFVALINESQNK